MKIHIHNVIDLRRPWGLVAACARLRVLSVAAARLACAGLLVLGLATAAWADGVVVPQVAAVRPARTPDQRALLRFDGTTQTLVIETTVAGQGRDFAWILPLPAAPTIEASTTGLFPTLDWLCAPAVEDLSPKDDRPDWIGTGLVGLCVWAAVRMKRPLLFAALLLLLPSWIGCGADTAKSGESPEQAVRVLARQRVGVFDTATLDAGDPTALRRWLDTNGFRAPEAVDAVIADYVRQGWVFVASKVHRDADDDAVLRLHPLAFTFPAREAVYPMRLTGAANESVALELYVAGDRRAEAPGLRVERCAGDLLHALERRRDATPAGFPYWSSRDEPGELGRRCAGAEVLTKLVGTLDRASMGRDLVVQWTNYVPAWTAYVTDAKARRDALAAGSLAFAAALVAAAVLGRRGSRGAAPRVRRSDGVWVACLAVTLGAATVATTASFVLAAIVTASTLIPAALVARRWSQAPPPLGRRDFAWIAIACAAGAAAGVVSWSTAARLPGGVAVVSARSAFDVESEISDPPRSLRGDAAGLRGWARSILGDRVNPFTREAVREEDSPGNWLLHEEDGRLELVSVGGWPRRSVLDVSRLAVIHGVVRTAGGDAVAGADVRLTDTSIEPVSGEFFASTLHATTDQAGRYRLEMPCGRRWHVSVVHRDHPYLLRRNVDLRDPPADAMDFSLPRERPIRGRVLDAEGRAIPGASVFATRSSPFETHSHECGATSASDGTFEVRGFDAEAPEIAVTLHLHRPGSGHEMRNYEPYEFTIRPGDPPVELRVSRK